MTEPNTTPRLPTAAIERAVKLSYVQAMLGAVYGASTGGMFLIGYALKLGATDVQLGMMSTIPMLFIGVQLLTAALIERGASRRALTAVASLLNALCWAAVIVIPYLFPAASPAVKIGVLIGIITLATFFAYVAGNARGSWVGDLIPANSRGTFFGRLTMYAGIIGAVFAVIEGFFLDGVNGLGLGAFSLLFGFGMLFGLVSAALFFPQADVPITVPVEESSLNKHITATLANGPLLGVMLYAILWSGQVIAGPFYTDYMLKTLHMPFKGMALVNTPTIITMLIASPFWGRIVDRYGCRPVLILCSCYFIPLPIFWLWYTSPFIIYCAVIPLNLIGGIAVAGISVALSTLLYKVTPSAGRSVQLAVYSIIVTLLAAGLPTLGGCLPWMANAALHACGIAGHADIRLTIVASSPFFLAAALAARGIREENSGHTREMLRELPGHLRRAAEKR